MAEDLCISNGSKEEKYRMLFMQSYYKKVEYGRMK